MNLLILGGTIFLGRHLVEAAQARGHVVTLFNRGQHNPDLFPDVEKLRGDRKEDLSALDGRRWDAVVDTCGYVPRVVRRAAEALAGSVGHYTFISSLSVYQDFAARGMGEDAPIGTLDDPTVEEVTGETYGPLKALCEQAAEQAMPGRVLSIRAGLIVGPHDPTDRFTHWPVRVARGGDVLAPGSGDALVQFVDVRDLAAWNVRMIEQGKTGAYNATGPQHALTMRQTLETCKSVGGSDARLVWVPGEFLEAQDVSPWMEMPLWVGDSDEMAGFSSVNCEKAIAEGLEFRSLEKTVRDTLAWVETWPPDRELRAGLTPEKEQAVLAAWRQRESGNPA